MRSKLRQFEFRWSTWLFGRKATPAKPTRKTGMSYVDGGLTAWCAEQAEELSMMRLKRLVKVRWNGRMTSSAGRATWPDCLIELNPRIKQLGDDEMWQTLRHELAHLVAYERNCRRRIDPHGPEWQQACADLGIPGEQAYHDLQLPSRKLRAKHLYQCRHCRTEWQRVKPLRRAVACYDCCWKHNGGRYDDRFRMVKVPLAAAVLSR